MPLLYKPANPEPTPQPPRPPSTCPGLPGQGTGHLRTAPVPQSLLKWLNQPLFTPPYPTENTRKLLAHGLPRGHPWCVPMWPMWHAPSSGKANVTLAMAVFTILTFIYFFNKFCHLGLFLSHVSVYLPVFLSQAQQ
ncbi:small integral membrane protein 47 isoform X1 [Symphalangus syndactylus]|uniref:small integral membrane protein 47 isoform X1 n=1 Tax=Symphalangus syndactylus TaxID=9590 RepID=UPI00300404F7